MNATTVAVDLAKSVFQLAVADEHWRIVETQRLTRTRFERWFANRAVDLVIMEACGSAHHWARWLSALCIQVRLLPAQYVPAYVRRNKTDATDAAALLEAARASDMRPVLVKSVEQQALQGLHRIRSLWMGTRTSRINALRGFLREFGIVVPVGARTGLEAISRVLGASMESARPSRQTIQAAAKEPEELSASDSLGCARLAMWVTTAGVS
jgi:transposase